MQTFPWWSRQNWQVVIILMVRKVTLLTSALTASTFFYFTPLKHSFTVVVSHSNITEL